MMENLLLYSDGQLLDLLLHEGLRVVDHLLEAKDAGVHVHALPPAQVLI